MPTANPFPLQIVEKVNSPELQAALQQFGHDKYADAEDFNKIITAINYLYENRNDLPQVSKTITANTIINDSFHNAIVFIKASATITLPAGLRTDLNFVTQTFTGCIATYVVGAGATISTQSSGTTQAEDKDGSVRKDGANNYILRGI